MGACRYLDLRRKFLHRVWQCRQFCRPHHSHGVVIGHLGMGARSPKDENRETEVAASVSSYLDGGRLGLFPERDCVV